MPVLCILQLVSSFRAFENDAEPTGPDFSPVPNNEDTSLHKLFSEHKNRGLTNGSPLPSESLKQSSAVWQGTPTKLITCRRLLA